jgi:hypothetical protein
MPKAGQKTQFYAASPVVRRNKASKSLFHDQMPQPNVGGPNMNGR